MANMFDNTFDIIRTRNDLINQNLKRESDVQNLHLHLVHPVHDVKHLLEDSLQAQVHLQPLSPGLQQLQQVVPQPHHVVFTSCDAFDVVVVLCLQLLRHSNHCLLIDNTAN